MSLQPLGAFEWPFSLNSITKPKKSYNLEATPIKCEYRYLESNRNCFFGAPHCHPCRVLLMTDKL